MCWWLRLRSIDVSNGVKPLPRARGLCGGGVQSRRRDEGVLRKERRHRIPDPQAHHQYVSVGSLASGLRSLKDLNLCACMCTCRRRKDSVCGRSQPGRYRSIPPSACVVAGWYARCLRRSIAAHRQSTVGQRQWQQQRQQPAKEEALRNGTPLRSSLQCPLSRVAETHIHRMCLRCTVAGAHGPAGAPRERPGARTGHAQTRTDRRGCGWHMRAAVVCRRGHRTDRTRRVVSTPGG